MPSGIPTVADALADRQGQPIRLKGGTLAKHKKYVRAWLDLAKAPTSRYYYIVVENTDPEDPEKTMLEPGRAEKSNVVKVRSTEPATYLEAVLRQYPHIELHLTNFCIALARCRVTTSDELVNLFKQEHNRCVIKIMKIGPSAFRTVDETIIVDDDAGSKMVTR